jgi:hypothetical protein
MAARRAGPNRPKACNATFTAGFAPLEGSATVRRHEAKIAGSG